MFIKIMNINFRKVFVCLAIYLLGLFSGVVVVLRQDKSQITIENKKIDEVKTLSKIIYTDFLINKKGILFMDPNKATSDLDWFKYDEHPILKEKMKYFETGFMFLKVTPIKLIDDRDVVVVINSFFDHGGFGSNYGIVYDFELKKVLYETPKILDKSRLTYIQVNQNGSLELHFNYGHFASCMSCGFDLHEFVSYDAESKSYFLLANNG